MKIIYIIALFILNVCIFVCLSYSDSWHIITIDSASYLSEKTDIAIDNNNQPHIVYDGTHSDLKYAHWNGNKWNIQVFKGENEYLFCDGSIAIDSNNYPHITFSDYYYYSVYYARWDGSKWIREEVPAYTEFQDLVIDSKDNPHISFSTIMFGAIDYTYKVGDEWKKEIVDKDGVNWYPKIVIDSNDCPQISYIDYKNGEVKYAIKKGDSWEIQIVDKPEGAAWYKAVSSIVVDRNNYPHITYFYFTYPEYKYYLKYAILTGSKWDIQVVESECGVGYYPSIALDKNDYPHIAYYDGKNGDLKYAWWDGSKWNIEVVDSEGDVGSYCSIGLKKDGSPCISYYDATNGNLKYAWYGPENAIDLTSFSAKPNNDAITLNWSVSTDEDISGFNLYRRVATPTTVSNIPTVGEIATFPLQTDDNSQWTRVNTSLITGTNPYSYTDRDVLPDINYEYKLEAVVSDKAETLGTKECTSGNGTPGSFDIASIYPTPAYDRISIDVIIPEQADIDIAIYDIAGRRIATVASGLYNPGEYTLSSDITGLSDGVYIMRMTAGGLYESKRFVVAK